MNCTTSSSGPRLMAALCLAAAACSSPTPTPDNDTTSVEPGLMFQEEFDEMVSVLLLTPEQEERLKLAYEIRDAELTEWMEGPEGQALLEQENALREAVADRSLTRVRAITRGENKRTAFAEKIRESEQAVMDVLTPEQQLEWQGHLLATKLLDLMEPLTLSLDQSMEIMREAANRYDGALQRNEPNPKAAAFLSLEKWAESTVLEAQQRSDYEAVKKEHPLRSL